MCWVCIKMKSKLEEEAIKFFQIYIIKDVQYSGSCYKKEKVYYQNQVGVVATTYHKGQMIYNK